MIVFRIFSGRPVLAASFAGALMLCGLMPASSATNLVVNGTFEKGPNPGSFATLNGHDKSIPGWAVTGTSVDYIGTYWKGADGGRSIDLDGTPGPGGVEQTIATKPNTRYVVMFSLSGNGDCGPPVKQMQAIAGIQKRTFTWSLSDGSAQGGKWVKKSFDFTAAAAHTTLMFRSLDPPGNCGPVLDDVSVKPAA